jgi:hypothetical protein
MNRHRKIREYNAWRERMESIPLSSIELNSRKRAESQMRNFDALPRPIRDALNYMPHATPLKFNVLHDFVRQGKIKEALQYINTGTFKARLNSSVESDILGDLIKGLKKKG